MMFGEPVFSIHFDHKLETFDTPQRPGQPAATTGDPLSALADWKGERSRRVLGDASTAGPEGTEERSEQRGRPSGDRVSSERQRREPRAHESVRASEALSTHESTSGTEQSTASQPIFHQ